MVYCGIFSINELIDVKARRSSNQCSSNSPGTEAWFGRDPAQEADRGTWATAS